MTDLVRTAATFFQQQSGCEAVGIRIKMGDDYPYHEARGFPREFVEMENSLCARDAAGNIIRDSLGNPSIECMCGNVIEGRVDPSKPFFSPGEFLGQQHNAASRYHQRFRPADSNPQSLQRNGV